MKRACHLLPQITEWSNLLVAEQRASTGRHRRIDVAAYAFDRETQLLQLQWRLEHGRYRMAPYHVFRIEDPKPRQIAAASYPDRVAHHALCSVIGPILDRSQIADSYACRTGKGSFKAIERARRMARRYRYYLKCDIRRFFASVDHAVLQILLARKIKDPQVLRLCAEILAHQEPDAVLGKGLPIGNLSSQHFANFYLGGLDWFIKQQCRIPGYLRYMDDFLLFADDKPTLWSALADIREWLARERALALKEQVTRLAPVTDGVPFLGHRIYPHVVRLQRSAWLRAQRGIAGREDDYRQGKIDEGQLIRAVASHVGHLQHAATLQGCRQRLATSRLAGLA